MKHLFALIAGIGILAACGSPAPEGTAVIEISDAFIVKPAGGRDIAGAGMTVTVTTGKQTLLGAETDVAERIEFHTMGMKDGRMQMRQMPGFDLDSETPLVMERGGKHMMMFGFDSKLEIGDEVDVVLQFDDGQGKDQFLVATMPVVGQGD